MATKPTVSEARLEMTSAARSYYETDTTSFEQYKATIDEYARAVRAEAVGPAIAQIEKLHPTARFKNEKVVLALLQQERDR
jgi:hypothetical protein